MICKGGRGGGRSGGRGGSGFGGAALRRSGSGLRSGSGSNRLYYKSGPFSSYRSNARYF